MRTSWILSLVLGFALTFPAGPGRALAADEPGPMGVRRFAILIGANDGGPERVRLRYATQDAASVGEVLSDLGGVDMGDQILLLDPSRGDLDRGFAELAQRVSAAEGEHARTEIVFYYSGHSDEEGLRLGDDLYPYPELKEAIFDVPADVRLAILDSCASGAMTRAKGGQFKAPFLVDDATSVTGYAILTSSSADEAAQESDRIGASFFTHSLVSGLRGAADTTGDSRVTLNEVYNFAFNDTLARTEKTQVGPQHPAYDIQLAGTGDLVLTDLRETSATLYLSPEVGGRIFVRDAEGRLVVEVRKLAGQAMSLALEPGVYDVTVQVDGDLKGGQIALAEGGRSDLDVGALDPFDGEVNRIRGDSPPPNEGAKTGSVAIPGLDGRPRVKVDVTLTPGAFPWFQWIRPGLGLPDTWIPPGAIPGEVIYQIDPELAPLPTEVPSEAAFEATLRAYEANQDALEANRDAYEATRDAYERIYGDPGAGPVEIYGMPIVPEEEAIAALPQGSASRDTYEEVEGAPFSLGLAPRVEALNGLQIGLLAARVMGPAEGLQLSTLANSAGGPMEGAQMTALVNQVHGPMEGAQLAGLVNTVSGSMAGIQAAGLANRAAGSMEGAQLAGLANTAAGPLEGWQAAGLANRAAGSVQGVQSAGLVNTADGPLSGLQAAGLVNVAHGSAEGLQAAGLVNVAHGNVEGLQAAGLVNVARGDVEGLQAAGLVNVAERVDGLQLGLINIADHVDGLPFGLLNIITDGERRLSLYETDMGLTHLSFHMGSHRVYTQLNVGWDPTSDRQRFAYGGGVGVHYGRKLWLNADLLAHQLVEPGASHSDLHLLNQARVLFGFQVIRRFGVFIGPTFNVLVTDSDQGTATTKIPDVLQVQTQGDPVNVFMWPGLTLGMQFL